MFHRLDNRIGHYLLLFVAWAAVCLPNLGLPSLHDIDEGNNAECTREMKEARNFILPTFNYKMRVDKPVLLYWLQMAAYHFFGVNEMAARLPSALAMLVALLAVYELGRLMFGPPIGLLAGLILGSMVGIVMAGRFANPDALLLACTLMGSLVFYRGYALEPTSHWGWFFWTGAWSGLGMLAKGPVALVLPLAVGLSFLFWERQLRKLWDWRLALSALGFTLTAVPWYVWVALETKGAWLRGFFWTHNVDRALAPMENHAWPIWYYALVLLFGFGLWSCFLISSAHNAMRRLRGGWPADRSAVRFLLCWMAVYFIFFSLVQTKLPNYVLPLYPAAAILIGCALEDWRRGRVVQPGWYIHANFTCLVLGGLIAGAGLLAVGGVQGVMPVEKALPGLEKLAGLGALPILGAAMAWRCLQQRNRDGVVLVVALTAVIFTATLAATVPPMLDGHKAPRTLVEALPEGQLTREVRMATLAYFQPSLVFYCQREVRTLDVPQQAVEFLKSPLEAYLFLPAETWEKLRPLAPVGVHVLARQRDLYKNCDVVLVGNR